jgi:DNA-binding response OmpR family regulator
MTSLSAVEDKVKGFDVGATDYVTKPLQIEEVRARISAHLKLHALQIELEKNNVELQREIAEHKIAKAELKLNFMRISDLNDQLRMQAIQLEASHELIVQTEEWYRSIIYAA